MSKKLFIIDTLKTISSSLLIALGLQFISYPFIHRILGDKSFGQILTIYTIITISSVVLGNTLNNIRLINVDYYSADYYYSKFRKVLHISVLIETLILFIIFQLFFNLGILETILILVVNYLMCLRVYLNVFFRMKLDYNKILYVAIIQFVGMMIGLLIFFLIHYWVLIFLVSESFALLYTFYELRKVKAKSQDSNSKPIVKDFIMLFSTNGLNNINLYLDRLIILPIIGGKAVTLAFLATFIGKMLATFMSPINNVLLSYISVNSNLNKFKQYVNVNLISFAAMLIVLIISYPLTIFVVSKLYQTDVNNIKSFIIIGNLGVLINSVTIAIQALNTRYASITKQANYIGVHTVIYILLSIFFTNIYGLAGFFGTMLILNLIKFLVLNTIGFRNAKKSTV
ncbi:capsular biosynthesis protein [Staphylococcus pragensis]|uniref:Capsular biosynthesis protein n=1 Tax=Staphylococcus pragensis TaxID=1611836 RepID=A0A4Z1BAS5_9STAP|nr:MULTISPECIES: capsular biosynthesis protein [Staphylococcus]RTX89668.1 capsular biosynthesis protein [Staphylococcus carnosus]TGN24657.1 capsular biosynthesis protein [Staphylococcus pragensis]GGG95857.1 capsular polysaccharide biosynthesis protein [Staphylococcus pragensis]